MYLIAAVIYALDQILKWLVRTHMHIGQTIPVLPPVVVLEYIRNPGGAFSIFPHWRWLFVVVAAVVTAIVIVAERRWRPRAMGRIGLACLLAGALGNMTDRVVSGTVVDYVYFKIIHFPIFNLADVAVDVGILLILLETFRSGSARERSSGDDIDV